MVNWDNAPHGARQTEDDREHEEWLESQRAPRLDTAPGTVMDMAALEAAPPGTVVLDWERDYLRKEETDGWYYLHQPLRGNVPRPFSSEVLATAYGPVTFYQADSEGI